MHNLQWQCSQAAAVAPSGGIVKGIATGRAANTNTNTNINTLHSTYTQYTIYSGSVVKQQAAVAPSRDIVRGAARLL